MINKKNMFSLSSAQCTKHGAVLDERMGWLIIFAASKGIGAGTGTDIDRLMFATLRAYALKLAHLHA